MTPIEIVIIAGKQASYDANEIVRLIDVLRAGNDKEIFPEINRRKAAPTAITVQNALFTRLHTVVCRHYGPVRDGDYSAGTAFKLLDDASIVEQANQEDGNKDQIKNWRLMWDVYSRDPKLKAYIHIRNKEVAHLAFKDPSITPSPW
jgi:HEPN superfamily AbiU2-like protein